MASELRQDLEQRGYALLAAAVPRAQLRPVQQHIAGELKRLGMQRSIPKTITALPPFQQIVRLSSQVNIPNLAEKIVSPRLSAAVQACNRVPGAPRESQLLLSPPNQGPWRLDGLNWHTDVSRSQRATAGLQVFVLIDDVEPHGGGTLILAGSHATRRDKEHESHLREVLHEGSSGEAELRRMGLEIVELSGNAGDAYLMDMGVLHTPSINASARLRMVATLRYFGSA